MYLRTTARGEASTQRFHARDERDAIPVDNPSPVSVILVPAAAVIRDLDVLYLTSPALDGDAIRSGLHLTAVSCPDVRAADITHVLAAAHQTLPTRLPEPVPRRTCPRLFSTDLHRRLPSACRELRRRTS